MRQTIAVRHSRDPSKIVAAAEVHDDHLLLRIEGIAARVLDAALVPKVQIKQDGKRKWAFKIDIPMLWELDDPQKLPPALLHDLKRLRPDWFVWLDQEAERHRALRAEARQRAEVAGAAEIEAVDRFEALPQEHPWHRLRSYQKAGVRYVGLGCGRVMLGDDMGLGKAQPLDAAVLTPYGFTPIGSLRPGDLVVDPDGGTGTVLATYPQGVRQLYKITFSDGTSTRCCAEHLWMIQSPGQRMRGTFKIKPLKDFMGDLERSDGRGWRTRKHFVPLCQPTEPYAPFVPPIDPYLLGVLLGDGGLTGGSVTLSNPDPEILASVQELLPSGISLKRIEPHRDDYRLTSDTRGRPNPLLDALRAFGTWGKRSVDKSAGPMLNANISDRLALLRGLMDTDGDCTEEGTCTFSTSSEDLADDIVQIVRSLGGIATTSSRIPTYTYKGEKREGQRAYRVNIRLPVNPFTLPRKAGRWKMPILAKAIERVEQIESAEAVCIAVDTKRHLYITDDFIVTHNTIQALAYLATEPSLRRALIISPSVVTYNWVREARLWAPELAVHAVSSGAKLKRLLAGDLPEPYALAMSWGLMTTHVDTLAELGLDTLVADEIHYAGNPDSLRTKALWRLGWQAERRIGLTGTEIRNRPKEIWPLLRLLDPLRFKIFARFGERYCGPRTKSVPQRGSSSKIKTRSYDGASNLPELNQLIRGYVLRRTKTQVAKEIPPKTRQLLPLSFSDVQRKTQQRTFEAIKKKIGQEGTKEQLWAMGALSKLRKEAGLFKVGPAAEWIETAVSAGEPVVVFLYHHEVREALMAELAERKIECHAITGETPTAERDQLVERFQAGAFDVLIGSTAMVTGVTLTRSRLTLHVERYWVPADEEQAEDRVCRIGQDRMVLNVYLHLLGSIDEYVNEAIERKRKILGSIQDRSPIAGDILRLITAL